MQEEVSKLPNRFTADQFVSYIHGNDISDITASLGHTLSQNYNGEELILIGTLKGSITFMAELVRMIKNVNLSIDFVKLSSVGRQKESNGTIVLEKDITTDISGKNVLIVEDIIDTGRALYFLKEHLKQSSPRKIEIITLFDKPYKRAVPITADYIGKKIDDQFIIGHGLDLEDYGRNLENVYYLKYPN